MEEGDDDEVSPLSHTLPAVAAALTHVGQRHMRGGPAPVEDDYEMESFENSYEPEKGQKSNNDCYPRGFESAMSSFQGTVGLCLCALDHPASGDLSSSSPCISRRPSLSRLEAAGSLEGVGSVDARADVRVGGDPGPVIPVSLDVAPC